MRRQDSCVGSRFYGFFWEALLAQMEPPPYSAFTVLLVEVSANRSGVSEVTGIHLPKSQERTKTRQNIVVIKPSMSENRMTDFLSSLFTSTFGKVPAVFRYVNITFRCLWSFKNSRRRELNSLIVAISPSLHNSPRISGYDDSFAFAICHKLLL